MTAPDTFRLLNFFATPPHPCSYLPEREAVTVFADPHADKNQALYSTLSRHGFRRSGAHIYRPRCAGCDACVPVRVPVAAFHPRRSQRRTWVRNRDLEVRPRRPGFDLDHYRLYTRYLEHRHPGGGMDDPSPEQFMEFLTSAWADTVFLEFVRGERLLAVAVADVLDDGLSAVYTFFDPAESARSLGVYGVLWEIAEARRLGLDYLYLGYWIARSSKMRYKSEYQPLEYLHDGHWRRMPPGTADLPGRGAIGPAQ